MLQAGLNIVAPAVFVLGLGALLYGLVPRLAAPVVNLVIVWSFLVQLIGSTLTTNRWLLDSAVLSHLRPAPAATPDWTGSPGRSGSPWSGARRARRVQPTRPQRRLTMPTCCRRPNSAPAFSGAPEQVMDHAVGAGHDITVIPIEEILGGSPQPGSGAENHGCDRDVERVDEAGVQELPHGVTTT